MPTKWELYLIIWFTRCDSVVVCQDIFCLQICVGWWVEGFYRRLFVVERFRAFFRCEAIFLIEIFFPKRKDADFSDDLERSG